ncbi:hypothetical protein HY469_01940 [Candidatus Roizmanbacteria bacterium]|nr:hypothetical protein [Candidatus Roizmanbacteria bacterium]
MDNPPYSSQPSIQENTSPQQKTLPVFAILIAVLTVSIIVLGVYFLIPREAENSENISSSTQEPQLSGLTLLYTRENTTTELDESEEYWYRKTYLANIDNSVKKQVDEATFANYISPSGTKFMKITDKTFGSALTNDPTQFTTIVDVSKIKDRVWLGHPFWSPDETTFVYTVSFLPLKPELQIWTVDFDGNNHRMVGRIVSYPGGSRFLGYDFELSIAYVALYKESLSGNTILYMAYDTNKQELSLLRELPADIFVTTSIANKTLYYGTENSVKQYNWETKEEETIFSTADVNIELATEINPHISPNNNILLISLVEYKLAEGAISYDDLKGRNFILDLTTRELDTTLSQPQYELLNFEDGFNEQPHIPQYISSFSPDSQYIVLKAYGRGRICIWDVKNKKIIPFHNCTLMDGQYTNDKTEEDVIIHGWIRDIESVNLENTTPSPTLGLGRYGDTAVVQARNISRESHITTLLAVIETYRQDTGALPPQITTTMLNISTTGADLCSEFVPEYIQALPQDPETMSKTNRLITNCEEPYDTGFTIVKNTEDSVTISAPLTEQITPLSVTN